MKFLITGGAGFIGSNFVHYILEKHPKHEIVVLDKLTYAGNLDNLRDLKNNPNFHFVKGDICDKKIDEKLIRECDVILNFAAETHVDRSIIDVGSFVRTDVIGTYRLLEASRKYGIEKFIQISTDEVYGSIKNGSFKEDNSLKPSNPYSASKASGDLLAHSYFVTYDLPVIITRSSNNYGPYQHPEKLIPKLIINSLQNKPLPIYADGTNVRDWIYVLDNCKAIEIVLEKGKVGEIYNVGGENERTNLEVAHLILEELSKPERLITFVKDRLGHDKRYSLDCTKIKELGHENKTDFKDGLKRTIAWYIQNKWWWEPLL